MQEATTADAHAECRTRAQQLFVTKLHQPVDL